MPFYAWSILAACIHLLTAIFFDWCRWSTALEINCTQMIRRRVFLNLSEVFFPLSLEWLKPMKEDGLIIRRIYSLKSWRPLRLRHLTEPPPRSQPRRPHNCWRWISPWPIRLLTCATRVEVSRAFWRKTYICYGIMSMPHISSSFCHDLAVIGCLASVWKFVLLIASLRLLKPSRERVMDWVVHCLNAWMPECLNAWMPECLNPFA